MPATTRAAPKLTERDHMEGCPAQRIESFVAKRPADPDRGVTAATMLVTRCMDCGGQTVKEA